MGAYLLGATAAILLVLWGVVAMSIALRMLANPSYGGEVRVTRGPGAGRVYTIESVSPDLATFAVCRVGIDPNGEDGLDLDPGSAYSFRPAFLERE